MRFLSLIVFLRMNLGRCSRSVFVKEKRRRTTHSQKNGVFWCPVFLCFVQKRRGFLHSNDAVLKNAWFQAFFKNAWLQAFFYAIQKNAPNLISSAKKYFRLKVIARMNYRSDMINEPKIWYDQFVWSFYDIQKLFYELYVVFPALRGYRGWSSI